MIRFAFYNPAKNILATIKLWLLEKWFRIFHIFDEVWSEILSALAHGLFFLSWSLLWKGDSIAHRLP